MINTRVKTCKHRCHLLPNYVGMKRMKFASEMGYRKCKVCECYFFMVNEVYCGCCNNKLRIKTPRRTIAVKEKAQQFLISITVDGNTSVGTVQT